MHVSDVQIELLSRGELPKQEADAALAHIAQCHPCASRQSNQAAADGEIESSLRLLDYPVATADVGAIIRRAKRGRATSLWRLAAGVAFLATAGAAAAMPGSPIRAWINRGGLERASISPAPAPGIVSPQPNTPHAAGISVEASDSVTLSFDADQTEGSIRITLDTHSELRVKASGGTAGFEIRSNGLRVRNHGSVANYEVMVPTAAKTVRIRVADRWVFRKSGESITKAPRREQDGSYVVKLGSRAPRP